jgi:hypothetical protein
MQLNLPLADRFAACKSLLIAGMGGGFDLFCGLPIYFELRARGQTVHLANYSFSDLSLAKGGVRLTDTLLGVTHDLPGHYVYFPELYLAQWFKAKRDEAVTIWSFQKTGARPLLENYRTLVEHLGIDGILLIDGGVDSLMRGDEHEVGTLIEDAISLIAVGELKDIPLRVIACLGLGAEQDIAYAHVFENIARLTEAGAFYGACALVKAMEVYQLYEDAVMFAQSRPYQDSSVINSSVISAARGHFGNHHLTEKTRGSSLWISPLMPLYWFFDLPMVARRSLIYNHLRYTDTITDAFRQWMLLKRSLPARPKSRIPL